MSHSMSSNALPDPDTQPEFYSGVPTKRLIAWVFDMVLVMVISAVLATIPIFIGWFFFPFIVLAVSFVYRAGMIANASATFGMQLCNIELRNRHGERFDSSEAVLHTIAFLACSAFFLPQLVSVILMLMTGRGQGLHDMFLGSAAINRASRYS